MKRKHSVDSVLNKNIEKKISIRKNHRSKKEIFDFEMDKNLNRSISKESF